MASKMPKKSKSGATAEPTPGPTLPDSAIEPLPDGNADGSFEDSGHDESQNNETASQLRVTVRCMKQEVADWCMK